MKPFFIVLLLPLLACAPGSSNFWEAVAISGAEAGADYFDALTAIEKSRDQAKNDRLRAQCEALLLDFSTQ